ncbi:uncharacterized protein EDB91DRAFT_1350585 [Suillus paluster]|uniref:uncharacterized protein n=1 Tax=Suillus paluster TaxID=48578 RepID=UPI001B85FB3C|nr:uncharacterized protein EDB91DRAFT_1350585 [Suillus paluster]KAG1725998.1 hypothetical protein EDB91DRAFT_1350585 [Suillus paluster]
MLQVNSITPWRPSMYAGSLPPKRLRTWREARARCNAEDFAKDPVEMTEFISCSRAEDSGDSVMAESHIPAIVLDIARKRRPFVGISGVTDTEIKRPISAVTCLEYINFNIRADKQNQFHLRAEMTEQDKEVIRAAGRNEDTLPAARVLRAKMQTERLYANVVQLTP